MHYQSLAQLLREIQYATGWSEQEIAQHAQCSQSTVHRMRHSKGDVAFSVGQRIQSLHNEYIGCHHAVHPIREIVPYLRTHRRRIFVLWLASRLLRQDYLQALAQDIALLNCLDIAIVVVFAHQVPCKEDYSDQINWPEDILPAADAMQQAISDITASATHLACMMSLPNRHLHGVSTPISQSNYIIGRPVGVIDGVDMLHAGRVRKIDKEMILSQLQSGHIVLLPPLGFGMEGDIFLLSATEIAMQTATLLGADKLILIGDQVVSPQTHPPLPSELTVNDVHERYAAHPLLRVAHSAIERGVQRVHLVNARKKDALLREIFTRDGCGTMVTREPYEKFRTAQRADIDGILRLIRPLEEDGVLVKRPRVDLESGINNFVVIERDGKIISCAALYAYAEGHCGEISCMVTDSEYRMAGRGNKMLQMLEEMAQVMEMHYIFVLSTQTTHWFLERGFRLATPNELPVSRRQTYNVQRNAKVLLKWCTVPVSMDISGQAEHGEHRL